MERRTWRGGRDSIDHPPNQHDDVVNCVAGALTNLIAVEPPAPQFGVQSQSAPSSHLGQRGGFSNAAAYENNRGPDSAVYSDSPRDGVRQSIVLSTTDRRILDAVVSAPPELSGFAGDAAFASKIEERYLELTYPDKLASIEAKNAVVAEAEASMHIARNELRATLDSNLHPRDFDELMKPVETIRPWLLDNDRQVCEVGSDGKPTYRAANESDVAFGVRYKNLDEYKAAQGMDVAA